MTEEGDFLFDPNESKWDRYIKWRLSQGITEEEAHKAGMKLGEWMQEAIRRTLHDNSNKT